MADMGDDVIGYAQPRDDLHNTSPEDAFDNAAYFTPEGEKTIDGEAFDEIKDHYVSTGELVEQSVEHIVASPEDYDDHMEELLGDG